MSETDIFHYLKELSCCNACCLRYLGVKNPMAYESLEEHVAKNFGDGNSVETEKFGSETTNQSENIGLSSNNGHDNDSSAVKRSENGDHSEEPPAKKRKRIICVSCLGILQEDTWEEAVEKVKEVLDKKKYECTTFACALSAPMATLLREKSITLQMRDKFPDFDPTRTLTPLKEAWKWSFGAHLSARINKVLDSGAISPLLITVNMEYPDDLEELEPLKQLSPALFSARSQQRRRFAIEFTRRAVEQALDGAALEAMRRCCPLLSAAGAAQCVAVSAAHAPLLLGGRYIKLSRELPQTPWILEGKRLMESSVQEIIFKPIAEFYKISEADVEHRLKFMSAGREDVDVRCLGNGRPFVVEVSDPRCEPTLSDLESICEAISSDGRVVVKAMAKLGRDDLVLLKQGEETKCKEYELLCIKLTHTKEDLENGAKPETTPAVTQADIDNINSYSNVSEGGGARVHITQKTPIRVLHRRPLLTRERKIFELSASLVPVLPQLFTVRVKTSAGTYIKEWCCGELGRSAPGLGAAVGAKVDILKLDVTQVHLDWVL